MAKFKFEVGGEFESLTKSELDESIRTALQAWRQRGIGVKWNVYQTNLSPAVAGYLVPGPASGWGWVVKMVSSTLSAAGSVSTYYGGGVNNRLFGAPGAQFPTGTATLQVGTWTSNTAIVPPDQTIWVQATGANLTNIMVSAFQFPYERLADLL